MINRRNKFVGEKADEPYRSEISSRHERTTICLYFQSEESSAAIAQTKVK